MSISLVRNDNHESSKNSVQPTRTDSPGASLASLQTTVQVKTTSRPILGQIVRPTLGLFHLRTPPSYRIRAKINSSEGFMGFKSAQNLMLMPNLLSHYVGYNLNLYILAIFYVYFAVPER